LELPTLQEFYGSASIVGVEQQTKRNKGSWERKRTAPLSISRAENSSAEIFKAAIAESNSFEHFDLVVDTFGKSIGVGAAESAEDKLYFCFGGPIKDVRRRRGYDLQ